MAKFAKCPSAAVRLVYELMNYLTRIIELKVNVVCSRSVLKLTADSPGWNLTPIHENCRRVVRLGAASRTAILILAGLFHAPLTAERR